MVNVGWVDGNDTQADGDGYVGGWLLVYGGERGVECACAQEYWSDWFVWFFL